MFTDSNFTIKFCAQLKIKKIKKKIESIYIKNF